MEKTCLDIDAGRKREGMWRGRGNGREGMKRGGDGGKWGRRRRERSQGRREEEEGKTKTYRK